MIRFNTPSGFKLSPEQVVDEVTDFINGDPEQIYKIIIGTDSESLGDNVADFVTVIVIYKQGKGGRYFWRRVKDNGQRFYTLRDRLIHEVVVSLDMGKFILSSLKSKKTGGNWGFEIHADVGEGGPSQNVIQEVVGMIRANNFEPKTKPESYAASKVADRHL